MGGYVTQIFVKFFAPILTQEWQALIAAVSSIVGLFTLAAILPDAFTAGALTGVVVAAIFGIQRALAPAANLPMGSRKKSRMQRIRQLIAIIHKIVNNVWNSTELGSSGIAAALGNGEWLSVSNSFYVTGIYKDAREWMDNLLMTSYVNQAMKDNDAFIIFLPYGGMSYFGTSDRHNFTQDECASHWANDPNWPYFATCGISLGAGGKEGMAVVVRPRKEGWGTREWTSRLNGIGQATRGMLTPWYSLHFIATPGMVTTTI
ncbi:MAG: hypothetical protein LQ337_002043 [Flavoplaca oasis]|nr:MAG: hypothetical protein LQ337_002043 [Flavoplaca oasis]